MKKLLTSLLGVAALLTATAGNPAGVELKTMKGNPIIKNPLGLQAPQKNITRADDNNWFGYSFEIYDGLGPGVAGALMEAVIEIPEELSQAWKGLQIDAVNIAFGQSSSKDVNIYITKDLNGEPEWMQEATMTQEVAWNEVALTTPYTIDGDAFYVGYQSEIKEDTDFPVCIDGIYTELEYADILGIFSMNENGAVVGDYYHYGSQFGSVCLKLHLSTPPAQKFGAMLNTVFQDKYILGEGEKFDLSFSLVNTGENPIYGAEATVTIAGQEQKPTVIVLGEGSTDASKEETSNNIIPFGTTGFISLQGIEAMGEGEQEVMVTINTLSSPDGASAPAGLAFSTEIMVVNTTYPKAFLVEEYTGTWCGFCPRGMVGMHNMEEKYGNDGFIGIAIHYAPSGYAPDRMQAPTYEQMAAYYAASPGYPTAMLNRVDNFDPSTSTLQNYWDLYEGATSPAKIEVEGLYNEDDNTLTCTSTTTFGYDSNNATFAVAFVLTQNNVGPYAQSNYFDGTTYSLDGWNDKGSPVVTMYDHVARFITGTGGISESVPTKVVAETPYEYQTVLNLDEWLPDLISSTGTPVPTNINNCTLIAMLLNTETGEVVNASKMSLNGQAGVESLVAEPNDGIYRVYNPQGLKVLETKDASSINNLPAGIYIINGKKIKL